MRNLLTKLMLMATVLGLSGCGGNVDPSSWSESETDAWFERGEWRNGWQVAPDNSINRKNLAVSYFKNKDRWDSAFTFLKDNDLSLLEAGRHDIDSDNLYVSITDYNTKNEEDANYEAHRKYMDIQYVASGMEMIDITPLSQKDSVYQAYDETKDIEFFSVKGGKAFKADPEVFFIFFPEDAHKPGLKIDSLAPVRKVVVKVKID